MLFNVLYSYNEKSIIFLPLFISLKQCNKNEWIIDFLNSFNAHLFPECGGKMHLREGEYEKAHTDFFEAFKNYDESGSPR